MKEAEKTTNQRIGAGIILLLVTLVIVGVIVFTEQKPTTAVAPSAKTSVAVTNSSSTSATGSSAATYKDGTYSATGSYTSPGGKESILVNLTLTSDVVTDATVTSEANDPTASSYQSIFIGGYKSKVVGKKIASIKLSNVSGSSLTSMGFNNAVKKIELEAKA